MTEKKFPAFSGSIRDAKTKEVLYYVTLWDWVGKKENKEDTAEAVESHD